MQRLLACVLAGVLASPPALAADTEAPQIGHELLRDAAARQRIRIAAAIYDESAIFEPRLYYRHAGEMSFLVMSLASSGDVYVATIPEEFVSKDIEYYLEAFDEHGNGPSKHGTPDKPHRIRVVGSGAPPVADAPSLPDAPRQEPIVLVVEKDSIGAGGPERQWLLAGGFGAAGIALGGLAVFQFAKSAQAATNRDAAASDDARQRFTDEMSSARLLGIVASVAAAAALGGAGYFVFAPPR